MEWLTYLFGGISLISLVGAIINTISTNRVNRFIEQHDTLWDTHNQKKEDSGKLKTLQDNFNTHERKFEIFAATQSNANTLFSNQFEELKKLILHKEASQNNTTTSIFNVLERIEDKLDTPSK